MAIQNKHKQKGKVSTDRIERHKEEIVCPSHPAFSFEYVTSNKHYSFEYFKDRNDKRKASTALVQKLHELSLISWTDIILRDKEMGMESMPFHVLNFSPLSEFSKTITKDAKFMAFRFNNQSNRLIGIKSEACPIFHIIGYDFDYTAYSHGS